MSNSSKKILLPLLIIVATAIGFKFINDSTKEYIDGNVLHLPITNSLENALPSPWTGDGLITVYFLEPCF